MAGAGDIVTNLALKNDGFKKPAGEAVGQLKSLRQSTQDAAYQLDEFSQTAVFVGTATGIAASGMTSVASAATLVGGAVPGLNAAAMAMQTISATSNIAGVGTGALANVLFGIDRSKSPLNQVSQVIGKIGSAAVIAKLGVMGIGAVTRMVGKDSSRFDKWSSQLGTIALRAAQVRLAIFGISLAARTASAAVMIPFRAMTAAIAGVKSMAEAAGRAVLGLGKRVGGVLSSLSLTGGGAGGGMLAALAGGGLAGLATSKSISLAAELEKNTVAFETMLGSAEKAQSFLKGLQQFAAATPFEFTELVDASRRLMALGFDADNVVPVLRTVGDATAALGLGSQGIDRLTLALGQMRSKGKVSAQEINQLAEAGIPAWEMIASKIGVSIPEAMKMAENGAISAGTGINAVLEGMSSRFGGGMEKQSKTVLGLWSTLKDNISFAMTDIGKAIIEGFNLKSLMGEANTFLEQFRSTWLPGITTTINTVGQAFQRVVDALRNGWGQWIAESLASFVDFIANIDIYWGVAQQNVVLFVANSINRFSAFMDWLTESWSAMIEGLFTTLREFATRTASAFTSIAAGVAKGGLSGGVAAAITQSTGAAVDSKAFDKFAAKITSLPKMWKDATAETTPELEALYEELARRQAAATVTAAETTAAAAEAAFRPLSEDQMNGKNTASGAAQTSAAALQAGSRDAGSAIAKAFNNSRANMEQKKMVTLLASIDKGIQAGLTQPSGIIPAII